jgi:hypothetical protein
MAASSNVATPINPLKVLIGGTAQAVQIRRPEKASQTFLIGVPVQVDTGTGFIIEAATMNSGTTGFMVGFAAEFASNLSTSGVPKTLTYGKVQNQASAVLIPVGAPPNDGTIGINQATDADIFIGTLGDSNTATNAVLAQTNLGALFGMAKDGGNSYWYIDNHVTAVSSGAVVQIVDLLIGYRNGAGVNQIIGTLNPVLAFKVLHAAQQLSGN